MCSGLAMEDIIKKIPRARRAIGPTSFARGRGATEHGAGVFLNGKQAAAGFTPRAGIQ